jgi:5-methyltetrahydropteroyltriglutamate--homocysteine methyltransferase
LALRRTLSIEQTLYQRRKERYRLRAGEGRPMSAGAIAAGLRVLGRRAAAGEEAMKTSTTRILTSHAGSLPRPDALIEAARARLAGEAVDEARFGDALRAAAIDVVRRQTATGIDIPGDGEYGKSMGHRVNYGAWWSYSFQRLSGLELAPDAKEIDLPVRRHGPGEIVLTSMADRRDRVKFRQA